MTESMSVLQSLNDSLHHTFAQDPRVFLIGEDILDPYGGAFKVTRGLSTAFPERVWTAPISEAGMIGIATGMAMRGLLPVVEIMFGDFLSLAADQLINHVSKFHWMYSGGKSIQEATIVPLVIRTPMGGRRGYGPTHSQTLEKLFLGVPGLRILAPNPIALDQATSPGGILSQAILHDPAPVLFIENKLLYLLKILNVADLKDWAISTSYANTQAQALPEQQPGSKPLGYPTYTMSLRGAPPAQLTMVAYGYMAEIARQAVMILAYQHEIFVELILPTQIAPFDLRPLSASILRTHHLVTIEEGNLTLGWGAEVLARVAQENGAELFSSSRIAALDLPLPASTNLETIVLPGVDQIVQRSLEIV